MSRILQRSINSTNSFKNQQKKFLQSQKKLFPIQIQNMKTLFVPLKLIQQLQKAAAYSGLCFVYVIWDSYLQ